MYDPISITREELQSVIDVLHSWHELDSSHIDRKLTTLDSKKALKMLQDALRTKPLTDVMHPSDYMVQNVDGTTLYVGARFSGLGLIWPPIITYTNGKRYKFVVNEAIPSWMAGEFSGYASYKEAEGE